MNNNQEPSVDTPTSEMPTDEQFVTTSVETKKEIDNNFFKSRSFKLIIGISVILLLVIAGSFTYLWLTGEDSSLTTEIGEDTTSVESRSFNMTKFQSDEEFNEYFEESFASAFFGVDLLNVEIPNTGVDLGPQGQFGNLEESRSADRFSGTNVQVSSIDEPDILKSDGENIYFSGNNFGVIQPFIGLESRVAPDIPEQSDPGTRVVQVFPPQNIEGISTIDHRGEMLLSGNNLVIFASNRIVGYNVEDKTNPSQSWSLALDQEDNRRTRVVTSKLYNDNIYVVTGSRVRGDNPCPIPVFSGSSEMTVPCVDVFRPNIDTDVDSTYTVMKINPQNGVVENSISFVGSARESVVYMSENSIYVTSNSRQDEFDIFSGFFLNEMNDLLPDELIEKMKQISEYDISNESKFMEYQLNLEKHLTTLSDEEQKRVRDEMDNRMENYFSEKSREMITSLITKISVEDLEITSTGSVPGSPLNQFSVDEYNQNLRIATTSNSTFGSGSVNDVYVLDSQLNQIGSVLDMGITEWIYAVRFLGEKAYVVTFRQIDPFYVLDLSNPQAPEMKGELKIPGFSSYLHPLDNNRILGVGREGSGVKLSIFDVSDPNNPTEAENIIMEEFTSEVLNNHRAFLLDDQHKIFFIPAGNSGYVFNYDDGLQQQVVVEDINAQRAMYINDYLYIVGDKIVVLDENTWEEVARVDL